MPQASARSDGGPEGPARSEGGSPGLCPGRDHKPRGGELRWVRPPRQARSRETLDRILDAAEALVAEKGFDDTPVAEIVQGAGSSVGAFYTRFRDKEGLLHALYDRYYEQAIATADLALDPARWEGASISEILRAVVRFLVGTYREQRGLVRAFVIRNHTDPSFRARRERLLARRGEISHDDPERAATFALMLVFSTIDNLLFDEMRSGALVLTDDEYSTELTRACLAYLGAPEISRKEKP
jgi:AcrR family transcriptional regulator